jgi:hypothetical protein
VKRALPSGDYGLIHHGRLIASVEGKSLTDLVVSLTCGKLRHALAELAALARAAAAVEDRYSVIFKLDRLRPAMVADGLAELQARWPNVPIVFCETPQLAEEWTYRFVASARAWAETEAAAPGRITPIARETGFDEAPDAPELTAAEVRLGWRPRHCRPRSRQAPPRGMGGLADRPPRLGR